MEKHLNLSGPTYLGSAPPNAHRRRRLVSPLDGCLKDLELEDQAVSLVSQREPLLLQAVEVGECDQHPCTGLPCRHGGQCRGGGGGGGGSGGGGSGGGGGGVSGGGGRLQCACAAGYYGDRCGGRRSLCRPNPCEGGGRCISGKDQVSYTMPCLVINFNVL
jgi:hypothetical protein